MVNKHHLGCDYILHLIQSPKGHVPGHETGYSTRPKKVPPPVGTKLLSYLTRKFYFSVRPCNLPRGRQAYIRCENFRAVLISDKRLSKISKALLLEINFCLKFQWLMYTLPSLIVGGGPITDFLIFCHRFPLISTPPIYIKFRKFLNPLIIRNPPICEKFPFQMVFFLP